MNAAVTTDFHSHILPRADHGSDSRKTSIRQLEIMASCGIERVVATPHFYPMGDNVASFLENRDGSAAALSERIRGKAGFPDICLGAEVLVCEGMETMEGIEKLAIRGTRCMLLEMPLTKWSSRLFDTVEAIVSRGIYVVIAHIDRYPASQVDSLLELPVRAQLNPGAFFGVIRRGNAERWLSSGKVVAVGSDLHGADEKCYRDFVTATKRLGAYTERIDKSMKHILSRAKVLLPT